MRRLCPPPALRHRRSSWGPLGIGLRTLREENPSMRKTFLFAALACIGITIAAAPASGVTVLPGGSGTDYPCVGTLAPGTYHGNIVVPRNATCTFSNSTVHGNVKVFENAGFYGINNEIDGNIQGDH